MTLTIICFSSSQALEPQDPSFKESLCGNTAYKAEKKQLHWWVLGMGKSRARSASFSTVPLRGSWGTLKTLGGSEECGLKTTDPGHFTDEHHRGEGFFWGQRDRTGGKLEGLGFIWDMAISMRYGSCGSDRRPWAGMTGYISFFAR